MQLTVGRGPDRGRALIFRQRQEVVRDLLRLRLQSAPRQPRRIAPSCAAAARTSPNAASGGSRGKPVGLFLPSVHTPPVSTPDRIAVRDD